MGKKIIKIFNTQDWDASSMNYGSFKYLEMCGDSSLLVTAEDCFYNARK